MLFTAALSLILAAPTPLQELQDAQALRGALVCVTVTTPEGNPLVTNNSHVRAMPASNEKLLGAAYALKVFGPEYRPTIDFFKSGNDLVISTEGFPNSTYEQLSDAAKTLGCSPATKVWLYQGFGPVFPPGWELDDMPNPYANWVTAFTVDRGGYAVWAGEGKFEFKPQPFGAKVNYAPSEEKIGWKFDPFHKVLNVWGKMPKKFEELDTLAIPYPHESAAALFGELQKGDHEVGSVPDLTLVGQPLSETLKSELVPSNNYGAEAVLLMAARKSGVVPAQSRREDIYSFASKGLTDFLVKEVGIAPEEVTPVDGSGQSRHNYVTTAALNQLLRYELKGPFGSLFPTLLPTANEGTLKGRLKGVNIQAKTGTLDKVVALSGYLTGKSGKVMVFSVILNNFSGSTAGARSALDKFITRLSEDN